ncbi:unnamed protein product [Symbiodinium sp. CCMP2456]|nr:unnamed protein product [Symbiodinium sp. CCMP2456]
MQWGRTWLDEKLNRGNLDDQLCASICQEFAEVHGVQFFDTAEGYGGGTSEERLRDVLVEPAKDQKQPYPCIIATKFLPTLARWTHGSFARALQGSCKRLGVDAIDIYFIHTPIHPLPLEYWVHAACREAKAGRIREIGISNCNAQQVRRACAEAQKHGLRIAANQIMFNLLCFQSPELQETLRACQENHVQIIAYAPIGQGLLTQALTDEKFSRIRLAKMTRLAMDELHDLRGVIEGLASKYGKSMAQICLNWTICHGAIPLVGTRSMLQAQDTAGCLGWRLAAEDVEELDRHALKRSTLSKPRWKRVLFVTFITLLVFSYRVNRWADWLRSKWHSLWSWRGHRADCTVETSMYICCLSLFVQAAVATATPFITRAELKVVPGTVDIVDFATGHPRLYVFMSSLRWVSTAALCATGSGRPQSHRVGMSTSDTGCVTWTSEVMHLGTYFFIVHFCLFLCVSIRQLSNVSMMDGIRTLSAFVRCFPSSLLSAGLRAQKQELFELGILGLHVCGDLGDADAAGRVLREWLRLHPAEGLKGDETLWQFIAGRPHCHIDRVLPHAGHGLRFHSGGGALRVNIPSPSPVSLRAREVDEEEVLFNFNKKKKKGYDPNWERPFPRYIVGGGIFLTIVGFFGGGPTLAAVWGLCGAGFGCLLEPWQTPDGEISGLYFEEDDE